MTLQKTLFYLLIACLFISCKHETILPGLSESGYPQHIGAIMLTKCAISGCHNDLSYQNAANLNLTHWEDMFRGTVTGSVVIPYRPDFSSICYFTNRDSSLGIISGPSMPIGESLTTTEYLELRDWIANGAPDVFGNVKFADDPQRKKLYVTNRLCNVVTVLDAQTLLQMRYINVGNGTDARYPVCVKVSPDKKYWYVSFFSQTNIVQKFNAVNDELIGELNLGSGMWSSFQITSDSKYGYFVDNSDPGKIVYADVENMAVLATYSFGGKFKYPSGIGINEQLHKLYVGTALGNFVYSVDITDPLSPVIFEKPIDGSTSISYASSLDPIDICVDPYTTKCYVACQHSGEIRVVNMTNDSLVDKVTLGTNPASMAISYITNALFVSCPDDTYFSGNRGSVALIDIDHNSLIKKIKTGYQPYSIAIDDKRRIASVVNANISGPKTHHVSGCGQKLGYLSFIDLNTQNIIAGKQRDLAVFPTAIANR